VCDDIRFSLSPVLPLLLPHLGSCPSSNNMAGLSRDGWLLFTASLVRLFSQGSLSVTLILYLSSIGLSQVSVGRLLSAILMGDLLLSIYLAINADAVGRRTVLMIGALLQFFAGVAFATTNDLRLLLVAGVLGIVSAAGADNGPYQAVEQAAIAQCLDTDDSNTSQIFGYYTAASYAMQAAGTLTSGYLMNSLQLRCQWTDSDVYRAPIYVWAVAGSMKFVLYGCLSSAVEPLHPRDTPIQHWWTSLGIRRPQSRSAVAHLATLLMLDAFGGGFVQPTIIVYWFYERFHMDTKQTGMMMAAANVLGGLGALSTGRLVAWMGVIHSMVFPHFVSNVLLLLVALMPTRELAVIVLLLRAALSQVDAPARQALIITLFDSDERSAALGVTGMSRSIGIALSPLLVGYLLADPGNIWRFSSPFIISGVIKCIYDALLYSRFVHDEEEKKFVNSSSDTLNQDQREGEGHDQLSALLGTD
jgi:MFS family permease